MERVLERDAMKVGIIGAMQEEVALLRSRMDNVSVEKRARTEFCMGTLCGLDVVLVAAGVGKVNAASCTQQLIDLFAQKGGSIDSDETLLTK